MKNQNAKQLRFREKFGPYAVVTGASSGIGQAIANRLAEAGLNLILVARNDQALQALAKDFHSNFDIDCRCIPMDLGQETASEKLVDETRDLDVGLLVASAGFGTSGAFIDSPLQDEIDMLHVNCRSLMILTSLFGRRLANRGRGGMILLSSIVGFQGIPYAAHYAATKAYVQVLAEALKLELAPHGVDVLAAAPGPTQSGFADRAGMKMGLALKPLDIAQPILDALGKQTTVLPGFLSKLLVYSLAPLPRWARIRIMGQIMRGMTAHQLRP